MTGERGRGEPRERRIALGLVAVAPAVHEIGGPGRAQAGVVEHLEHRAGLGGEVGAVHVVDGVGELAGDPEALGGAEGGAVLDVALLGAVVPVHGGDPVAVLAGPGDDRGGADGGDRGEGGDAVGDVVPRCA